MLKFLKTKNNINMKIFSKYLILFLNVSTCQKDKLQLYIIFIENLITLNRKNKLGKEIFYLYRKISY